MVLAASRLCYDASVHPILMKPAGDNSIEGGKMALTARHMQQREGLITSSRAYDVAFGNHHKAWRSIKGLDTFEGNEDTERGDELEGAVRKWSVRRLAKTRGVRWRAIKPEFRKHPTVAWAGDSCDALYVSKSRLEMIGEIKTHGEGAGRAYGEEGTDTVAPYTLIQSQWHLWHYPEVETCLVSALIGGFKFGLKLFDLKRDLELQGMLEEAGARFWRDYIVTNREPLADAHDSTTDWFRKRFPEGNGGFVPMSPELLELAIQYKQAKDGEKRAKAEAQRCANRILAIIGDHSGARDDETGAKVAFIDIAGSTYTVEREPYRRIDIRGVGT